MSARSTPYSSVFDEAPDNYQRYRPRYPSALFNFLAEVSPRRTLAWDCGTGNGQAAISLARHFSSVAGTDASEEQLRHAMIHERVTYRVSAAQASGLDSKSVDLITAAQSLHWFDQAGFYREVRRVARDRNSIIAVWCYPLPCIESRIDALIAGFYDEVARGRWEQQGRAVQEGYRTIDFPFLELKAPEFFCTAEWDCNHMLGFVRSWSPVRLAVRETGDGPLVRFAAVLRAAWGNPESTRPVRWPVFLRVGRTG